MPPKSDNHFRSPAFEENVLFDSPLVRVGTFRCRPQYPGFADTGPIHDHLVVFPRTSVFITHDGGPTIVADPCTVMFYNRSQQYRREPLSEDGDLCEWFAFDHQILVEALSPYDPLAGERSDLPFTLTHGMSDSSGYLAQRRLVEALELDELVEPVFLEETLLQVLQRTVSRAYSGRAPEPVPRRSATVRAHRDMVENTKALLNERYCDDLRLADIARLVNSSPFHLGRVFRSMVGTTLHAYRDRLRLRIALERLLDGCRDLSGLAYDLGYSSHSHFSAAFGRAFGAPPSSVKRAGF